MQMRLLSGLTTDNWTEELQKSGVPDATAIVTAADFSAEISAIKVFALPEDDAARLIRDIKAALPDGVIAASKDAVFIEIAKPYSRSLPVLQQRLQHLPRYFVESLSGLRSKLLNPLPALQLPDGKTLPLSRPLVMGILNVTPDSFSDGGRFDHVDAALAHARKMLADGADIIDIGGESTRPGAAAVPAEEEWRRIGTVISELSSVPGAVISVDTYKSGVARKALESGAAIVNDISGGKFDPAIFSVAADFDAPMVLMHIQGEPRTMQQQPQYRLLMEDIVTTLQHHIEMADARGVRQVIVDPGIGFGKTTEHNLEIIRRLEELKILGCPVLLGASRKSFIGNVLKVAVEERLSGSISAHLAGICNGADIVRVHDVREHVQAIRLWEKIFSKTYI
jgi:dihydropteroate synthase